RPQTLRGLLLLRHHDQLHVAPGGGHLPDVSAGHGLPQRTEALLVAGSRGLGEAGRGGHCGLPAGPHPVLSLQVLGHERGLPLLVDHQGAHRPLSWGEAGGVGGAGQSGRAGEGKALGPGQPQRAGLERPGPRLAGRRRVPRSPLQGHLPPAIPPPCLTADRLRPLPQHRAHPAPEAGPGPGWSPHPHAVPVGPARGCCTGEGGRQGALPGRLGQGAGFELSPREGEED
uniref:Uncharacterized protein n=1 Tax=Sarcophilus harrisii TaxID=9305 RepID=A0A7N4PGA1_SARHA